MKCRVQINAREDKDLMRRIGLQFFGDADGDGIDDETGEPVTETVGGDENSAVVMPSKYVSDGTGGQTDKGTWLTQNGYSGSREEYGTKVGEMNEQTFYEKNNLDPDRDFNNTKKTLEYDYMTSMANYGANAEKLFQMGLSNSGVSDIFQANAFSTYLSNVNDAAAQRIEAKRKNRLAFQEYQQGVTAGWLEEQQKGNLGYSTYEQNYKSQFNTDTGNAYNAVLSSGLFTGEHAADSDMSADYDRVHIYLQNAGYSAAVIDDVWRRLNQLDWQAVRDGRALAAYSDLIKLAPNWKGSDEEKSHYGDLLKKSGYTDSNIAAAFDIANSSIAADEAANLPSDAKAWSTWLGENGHLESYDGSIAADHQLRKTLADNKCPQEMIDSVLESAKAKYSETLKLNLNKDASDIVNLSKSTPQTLTFGDFTERMHGYKMHLNNDAISQDEYDNYITQLKNAAENTVTWMLDNVNNLKRAYGILGYSADDWGDMDDGERYLAALDAIGMYAADGVIAIEQRDKIFNEWLDKEINSIKSTGSEEELDILKDQVSEFIRKGYLKNDVQFKIKALTDEVKDMTVLKNTIITAIEGSEKVDASGAEKIAYQTMDVAKEYSEFKKNVDNNNWVEVIKNIGNFIGIINNFIGDRKSQSDKE